MLHDGQICVINFQMPLLQQILLEVDIAA